MQQRGTLPGVQGGGLRRRGDALRNLGGNGSAHLLGRVAIPLVSSIQTFRRSAYNDAHDYPYGGANREGAGQSVNCHLPSSFGHYSTQCFAPSSCFTHLRLASSSSSSLSLGNPAILLQNAAKQRKQIGWRVGITSINKRRPSLSLSGQAALTG